MNNNQWWLCVFQVYLAHVDADVVGEVKLFHYSVSWWLWLDCYIVVDQVRTKVSAQLKKTPSYDMQKYTKVK